MMLSQTTSSPMLLPEKHRHNAHSAIVMRAAKFVSGHFPHARGTGRAEGYTLL